MDNNEVKDLIETAERMRWTHALVAAHLGITPTYWYQVRHGKKPLTDEVLGEVRKLKKKMVAFGAA